MNVVGLITEYNPFHNGHAYHIQKAKEITGVDYVVVLMSGDYVQRGTPAIMNKHTRAKIALCCGADMVFELPLCYATASAEQFAYGAISIFHQLGIVDCICFGSEHGEISLFQEIAKILVEEPSFYVTRLQENLKNGMVFPLARSHALFAYLECSYQTAHLSTIQEFLAAPNNILGIEYCKAIYRLNSSIRPYTIARKENAYHDTTLNTTLSSATAIRRTLFENFPPTMPVDHPFSCLVSQIPSVAISDFTAYFDQCIPMHEDRFSLLLKYKLMLEDEKSICRYLDVTPSLANRIYNHMNHFTTYSAFVTILKSKEITHTRIQRALLHILLSVEAVAEPSYVRLLGFHKSAVPLTSMIKKRSSIPLISKIANANTLLDDQAQKDFALEIVASNLYETINAHEKNRPFVHEFSRPVIVV